MTTPNRPPAFESVQPKPSADPVALAYMHPRAQSSDPKKLMATIGVFSLIVAFISTFVNGVYAWAYWAEFNAPPQMTRSHQPPRANSTWLEGVAAFYAIVVLFNGLLFFTSYFCIAGRNDGVRLMLTFVKLKIGLLFAEGALLAVWFWTIENDVYHPTLEVKTAQSSMEHLVVAGAGLLYFVVIYRVITKARSPGPMIN